MDKDVEHALGVIWGWAEVFKALRNPLAEKELKDAVRILKDSINAPVQQGQHVPPPAQLGERHPSPNYSNRMYLTPTLLVVHSTRSGQRWSDAQEAAATLNWFESLKSEVSAHYLVNAEGLVTPIVSIAQAAWHAGFMNLGTVGVELTQGTPDTPYTEGHYQGLALVFRLVNEWLVSNGAQPLLPRRGPGGLMGHDEVEQGLLYGKSDPGELFDWDYVLSLLAAS